MTQNLGQNKFLTQFLRGEVVIYMPLAGLYSCMKKREQHVKIER